MSFKPLPVATETSQPFWDALRDHQVSIQQCDDCQTWVFYPRQHCTHCLSDKLTWKPVSGNGTLYSYTLARVPTDPAFADEKPQKMAVVQLDEGPRINSTLVYLEEDEIKVGMRLKAVFDDNEKEGITLLRFTGEHCEAPAPEPQVEAEAEPVTAVEKVQVKCTDLEAMQALVSEEFSNWSNQLEVTQELINQFAELSGDDYWIHTDIEKAKKLSPFGGTIAQGALVQVLMTKLDIPLPFEVVGFNNMVNYGGDRLRFPKPVIVGSRIHARARVKDVKAAASGTQLTLETHIHVVGDDRPVMVSDSIIKYMV